MKARGKSLLKQRAILQVRNYLLEELDGDPKRLRDLNQRTLRQLRAESPTKLVPVLVKRQTEEPAFAAYLVQKTEKRGYRLLTLGEEWRIRRAKASAKVVRVPECLQKFHEKAIEAHIQNRVMIRKIMEGLKRRVTSGKKDLAPAKSKRALSSIS